MWLEIVSIGGRICFWFLYMDVEFLYDLSDYSLITGFWLLDCNDGVVKGDKGKVFTCPRHEDV